MLSALRCGTADRWRLQATISRNHAQEKFHSPTFDAAGYQWCATAAGCTGLGNHGALESQGCDSAAFLPLRLSTCTTWAQGQQGLQRLRINAASIRGPSSSTCSIRTLACVSCHGCCGQGSMAQTPKLKHVNLTTLKVVHTQEPAGVPQRAGPQGGLPGGVLELRACARGASVRLVAKGRQILPAAGKSPGPRQEQHERWSSTGLWACSAADLAHAMLNTPGRGCPACTAMQRMNHAQRLAACRADRAVHDVQDTC